MGVLWVIEAKNLYKSGDLHKLLYKSIDWDETGTFLFSKFPSFLSQPCGGGGSQLTRVGDLCRELINRECEAILGAFFLVVCKYIRKDMGISVTLI